MIPEIPHRPALLVLLACTALYAFLCLGAEPYYLGDEARGGINALEMLANGDWVNLHFRGAPDQVRAKPPLLIWCISASMAVFGKTAFALRFPSAVAIVGAFWVFFRIVRLYRSAGFALTVGLLLLSVSGLVGWHVGRTGDFDALLLLFLLSGLLCILKFLDFADRRALPWAGFFWGFAFLTKGLAMGALLPGLCVYLVATRRVRAMLTDRRVWITAGIFLLFPIFWFTIVQRYGATWEAPLYTGRNVFERLLVHDIWERFTETDFEGRVSTSRYDYILYSLDKMFNVWNFAFFGFLLYGLYRAGTDVRTALNFLRRRPLLLLSLCLWFPYALILSFTTQALQQYIVPTLPFVGVATVYGFEYADRRWRGARYVFAGALLFTLGRRLWQITHPRPEPAIVAVLPDLRAASAIYVEPDAIPYDELYYVYLANQSALRFAPDTAAEILILTRDTDVTGGVRDTLWTSETGVVLR